MIVMAEMLVIPAADGSRFESWSDTILNLSHTIPNDEAAGRATAEFAVAAPAGPPHPPPGRFTDRISPVYHGEIEV